MTKNYEYIYSQKYQSLQTNYSLLPVQLIQKNIKKLLCKDGYMHELNYDMLQTVKG